MNIYHAMQQRRSIRQFKSTPIEREVLKKVLKNAIRAPSWKNCQPYEVYVLEGAKKDDLKQKLVKAALAGQAENPDEPYQMKWPRYMTRRMFSLGRELYAHLDIKREDKEARERQLLRNFEFFDAPTVLFFLCPQELGFWPQFDIGIFYGYVTLALLEEGLGSCPQASLAAYPHIVKEVLGLDEKFKLLCGMSIGYPDEEASINEFISEREPLEELVKFVE